MSYGPIDATLKRGGVVILDGGVGTELERRGVPMDADAWCGPATLDHAEVLEQIHLDYIAAGADVITANTYATSRLMLDHAGIGDRFADVNRVAISAAKRARDRSGRSDVAIAGSVSHMVPRSRGQEHADGTGSPDRETLAQTFTELAAFHRDEGCDLVLVEMMYHPDRMAVAFESALVSGLPVWAGLAVRRDENQEMRSFARHKFIPFRESVNVLSDLGLAAAGIMHTPSNLIEEGVGHVRNVFDGPLLAYPDSGYFTMPHWNFEDIIPPGELAEYAGRWVDKGVQILGGCCGLNPEHIAAIAPLKARDVS